MQRSVGERTHCSFYSMRHCIVKGGCRNMRSWRQTDDTEWKMDEGMTATSQTIRRRWRDEKGFVAGQMERTVTALCSCATAISHSCTDPCWVYSGSPSYRGSGPSLAPSSSGPSSHSSGLIPLHAPWDTTLPLGCYIILERGGRGSDFLYSALLHRHTYMYTYSTHTMMWGCRHSLSQSLSPLLHCSPFSWKYTHLAFTHSQSSAHLQFSSTCLCQCSADWGGREGGEGGCEWSREKIGLSSQQSSCCSRV